MRLFRAELDLQNAYASYIQHVVAFTSWLAERLALEPQHQLIVTCGASGALDIALSQFLPGQSIAMMPYEYFDMVRMARQRGLRVLQPVTDRAQNDVQTFLDVLQQHQPDVCYVSLPNNPLGQEYSEVELKKILRAMSGRTVIIDRSLVARAPLSLHWFEKHAQMTRVFYINSFSKSHGLVAERIGYFIAFEAGLDTSRFAHAPSGKSMESARGAWESSFSQRTLKRILKNAAQIETWAKDREMYAWHGSATNFGALHVSGVPAELCAEKLKAQGIAVKIPANLECQGNFLRFDLTMPPTVIAKALTILSL